MCEREGMCRQPFFLFPVVRLLRLLITSLSTPQCSDCFIVLAPMYVSLCAEHFAGAKRHPSDESSLITHH